MENEELIPLIISAQSGDPEAIEELLRRAHTSVSYQCRKMLRDSRDAEDMTQEVLLVVYERLGKLKEPAAFWGWLNTITATRCINALKRNRVDLQFAEDEDGHSVLDELEELDEQQVPDKALDNAETIRMVEEIVNGLPEAQRICTLLYYYDEMSVRDIAETLDVPENTVKSRLNYARKAIKERVLDYEKKGVKLYGLSPLPFLLYFLGRAAQETADSAAAASAVSQVLELGGAAATAPAAGGTAATAAGTAAPHLLGGLSVKVIVGALVGVLAVGGIVGAVVVNTLDDPEPTVSLPEETQAPSGPTLSIPLETDSIEDEQPSESPESLEIPEPPDSPYDTITEYDPNTFIARTTMLTGMDHLEIYYEFPFIPASAGGNASLNENFLELRNEFFRDGDESIARALDYAQDPPTAGDRYYLYTCSIDTFNEEITSIHLKGSWYMGGVISGMNPAYTFDTSTGKQLSLPDVLPCSIAEYQEYLSQAVRDDGIEDYANLSGDTTQCSFYILDNSIYVGLPTIEGPARGHEDLVYVKLNIPIQATPASSSTGGSLGLLKDIAYYGDPAQCRMDAAQAQAFLDVIYQQIEYLDARYMEDKSSYDSMCPGYPRLTYAALVDPGNGIPILVTGGGLAQNSDYFGIVWEYLSTFGIWQYIDGQAVPFDPEDEGGGMGLCFTPDGLWLGWSGYTPYSFEIRKLNARLYPYQGGVISPRSTYAIYGDTSGGTINGVPATVDELDAALESFAGESWITSSVGGDPSGGYYGLSPAERVLDALDEIANS